jgi:P pilus assembly chaperone PapD
MNRILTAVVLLIAAVAMAQTPQQPGSVGALLVAPTRVVFNERTRTAEIALINTGLSATTYRISFRHVRMKSDGQLEDVEQADGERFADPYLLFTPRQVTLEPRVAQTIRVRLRLPPDASGGEYRVHLEFRRLPPANINEGDAGEGNVAIRIVPIYSVSIPLLVRRGATEAELSIDDLAVHGEGDAAEATFTLKRSGTRSTYGNVTLRFVPGNGAAEETVGVMNGVSIYVPQNERRMRIPLRAPLRNGALRVTYVDAEGTAGAAPVEQVLLVP